MPPGALCHCPISALTIHTEQWFSKHEVPQVNPALASSQGIIIRSATFRPLPRPPKQETQGEGGPAVCVLISSPGNSEAC